MRVLSLFVLLLPDTVAIAAVDASTRLLPLRPLLHLPARTAVAHLSVNMPESTEQLEQWPTELIGPWELRTTQPGSSSRMWVELADDRSCSCSAAVGKGSRWHAIRRGGKWQLSFVLLDKLKREVKYEGEVREDDGTSSRRLVIAGSINGPPRRMAGLSGGQKIKVVLGAALWQNPHILVMDGEREGGREGGAERSKYYRGRLFRSRASLPTAAHPAAPPSPSQSRPTTSTATRWARWRRPSRSLAAACCS